MAITQIGYLGGTGPVYRDDSPGNGKYILLLASVMSGTAALRAFQPAFAGNLGLDASTYTLGNYADSQIVGGVPSDYKEPSTGKNFVGYNNSTTGYVAGTGIPGATSTTTTGGGGSTTPTTTTTGGGGSTTPTTTTTSGGTTTDTVTYKAATFGEQLSTFASNYWWVLVILALLLLWNPVIAPALGMKKRKRSYR